MAKKKATGKQAQKKSSDARSEAESVKNIFDLALLKAKRIHEKYDISKPENSSIYIPKR